MSENLEVTVAPKRPAFLTVLCILTFIGSGWGIISSLTMQDEGISGYASYYYWVMLLLNLGTLFGAIFMWKLQKRGLFLYTICALASVILMWVVIKGYLGSIISPLEVTSEDAELNAMVSKAGSAMIAGAMNMMLVIGSLFPIGFVIMYWINAKHMK